VHRAAQLLCDAYKTSELQLSQALALPGASAMIRGSKTNSIGYAISETGTEFE
jgi:hypothetical protein